jgi:hypothetical protein
MSNHAEYAVPKDRQHVKIRLGKGPEVEGEIFLEYTSEDLSRHQKISVLLESDNAFFPLQGNAGIEFICKRNVRIVEVPFPEDPENNFFSLRPMNAVPIIAFFIDGDSVHGLLLAEVPEERGRLSDCLNLPDKFLNVRADGTMYYLNKEALQKVVYDNTK